MTHVLLIISVSLFFSIFSILAHLSDLITCRLYYYPIFLISLLAGVCAYIKLLKHSNIVRIKDTLSSIIFPSAFFYFLFSSLPSMFPVRFKWDGANHLGLINYLIEHLSHNRMILEKFSMPLRGELYSYPWGMHSVFAGLSYIFKTDTFLFIYPFMCIFAALIISSTVSFLIRLTRKRIFPVIIIIYILLFSKYTFYYMLEHSYWSQITGMMLVCSIIYLLDLESCSRKGIFLSLILLLGSVLIYPLYTIPVFIGFFTYLMLTRKISFFNLITYMFTILAAGYILTKPILQDNFSRLSKAGTLLLSANDIHSAVILFICVFVCPFSLYLLIKRKDCFQVFPLSAVFSAMVFLIIKTEFYWVAKLIYLSFFLMMASAARMVGLLMRFRQDRSKVYRLHVLVLFIIFLLFIWKYPTANMLKLKQVFSINEYKMRIWQSNNVPNRDISYVTIGMKKVWLEAIRTYPAIKKSKNYYYRLFKETYSYDPFSQFSEFHTNAEHGDLLTVNKKECSWKPSELKEIHSEGDIVLYEYRRIEK